MKIQLIRSGSYMGDPVIRKTDLSVDVKRVKLWSLLWLVSPRTRYARRCQEAIFDLCISSGHLALGVLGGQLGSRLLDAWVLGDLLAAGGSILHRWAVRVGGGPRTSPFFVDAILS